jgi:hypothetical protein
MAGLVPAIHDLHNLKMRMGYVYFLTNHPNGILYVGVTSILCVASTSIAPALLRDSPNATD